MRFAACISRKIGSRWCQVYKPQNFCNYLPPLSATFVEAVNGFFLQGDGDCDERVVSERRHGLEVARYPAVRFRKCHGAEAA